MPDVLQAGDFQPGDDPAAQLAGARETRIKNAIADALEAIVAAFGGASVLSAIASFSVSKLYAILNDPSLATAIMAAFKPIADTKIDAAEGEADRAFGALIPYDPLQSAAPLMAQRERFVASILGQARATMQQSIVGAFRYGANPEAVQIALQNVIALTPQQANAVANFRRLLEQGDPHALDRVLRDRRFDATVQRWIDVDAEPSTDAIDAMVERYAERQLAFRAETIARTEAMKAATGGIRDAYVQAVQSGRLYDSEVRRRWLVCIDERLCPVCASVPIMNPGGVGVLQPYLSIAGPLMTVGPHTRCRCSERYTANLSRLSVQPFAQAA